MSENAQRRSEGRARRRPEGKDRPKKAKETETDGGMDNVHQAVRTAAAAAAVGAAVGAARALASRGGDDASDADDHEDEHADQEPEPQAQMREPEPQDDNEDQEPDQEPATEARQEQSQHTRTPRRERARRSEPRPRHGESTDTVRSVADRAREQLRELHGREPESLTSLDRMGDGWRATFEVLELSRIPSSTDVLATYVVEVDDDLQLLSFERIRRYSRAQADHGDER